MKKVTWIIIIIIVLGFGYVFYKATSNTDSCLTAEAKDINVGGDKNVVLHIHPMLTITINGEDIAIPSHIGLENGIMRPLHTHDDTGEIHVESSCVRDYTLGDFFDVWGETFTSSCIMDYCTDETHTLTVYVNGVESAQYEDLTLKDKDNIQIVYEEIT